MYEYDIVLPKDREIFDAKTSSELEAFLEYNTDRYYVDDRHVIFSVDGNSKVRNEKYDPYFKMFPDCTVSLDRLTRKNIMYRVFFNRPVYTSHNSVAKTPPKMSNPDKILMMDSFIMIVESKLEKNKGIRRFLWEELKAAANAVMESELIFHELPERRLHESDASYMLKLNAEIERIREETSMYWDIVYDGKRR